MFLIEMCVGSAENYDDKIKVIHRETFKMSEE